MPIRGGSLIGGVLIRGGSLIGGKSAASGSAALALDTEAKGQEDQPTAASPYQYTFVPNNAPTKVFVAVHYFDATGSVTGVTYGGQSMTAQGAAVGITANEFVRVYELLNPTDTDSAVVEVTVDEDFTGMGVSVVSFTGGDTSATIRGSITTNTGEGTSATVTQSSATGDIVLCFGIIGANTTVTYSSGTKVGTDAMVFTQFLRTVAQNDGAASVAITAAIDFESWGLWAMSVKS